MCQQCHHSFHCCADLRSAKKARGQTGREDRAVNLSLCPLQVWWWWRLLSDPGKWESTQIMWLRPSLPAWETSSLCICLRGSAACFSATEVRRFLICVKALKCWCNDIRHKQQITDVCFASLNVYSNQFRILLIYRHVVPSSYCLWNLSASDTSLDCFCTSLSSYQTGPKVRLVSCHLSDVHQQVSICLRDLIQTAPLPRCVRINLPRPARPT